jgi:hypothetical protein
VSERIGLEEQEGYGLDTTVCNFIVSIFLCCNKHSKSLTIFTSCYELLTLARRSISGVWRGHTMVADCAGDFCEDVGGLSRYRKPRSIWRDCERATRCSAVELDVDVAKLELQGNMSRDATLKQMPRLGPSFPPFATSPSL